MSGAMLDIVYSIEKWFFANWSTTPVRYSGQPFDDKGLDAWLSLHVWPSGLITRKNDYGATILISTNIYSRVKMRDIYTHAQSLEVLLRAGSIELIDNSDQVTSLGFLKLGEPELKALREDGDIFIGTLDVRAMLFM